MFAFGSKCTKSFALIFGKCHDIFFHIQSSLIYYEKHRLYFLRHYNLDMTLAEVEAKAENCKSAIEAYEEALEIYSESEYPEIFPLVEANLNLVRDFCAGD